MPSIRELLPQLATDLPDLEEIGLSSEESVEDLEATRRHDLATWAASKLLDYSYIWNLRLRDLLPLLRNWYAEPVSSQSLQARSYNALFRAGVTTWGEVAALTPAQLSAVRNLGQTSVTEIVARSVELSMGAHVTKGTIDDAIVASALGNMAHGESLSVDERNNAIRRMIVEYSRESKRAKAAGEPPLGGAQRWVASVMGVSQTTVQRVMKTDQIRLLDKETFSRKANDEGKVEGPSDSFIAEFHPLYTNTPEGKELAKKALNHAIAEDWSRADAREFAKLKAHGHNDVMKKVLASHGPPPRVGKKGDVGPMPTDEEQAGQVDPALKVAAALSTFAGAIRDANADGVTDKELAAHLKPQKVAGLQTWLNGMLPLAGAAEIKAAEREEQEAEAAAEAAAESGATVSGSEGTPEAGEPEARVEIQRDDGSDSEMEEALEAHWGVGERLGEDAANTVVTSLRTLAAWGVQERDARHMEDILHLSSGVGTAPPEVTTLWNKLGRVELRQFADQGLVAVTLDDLAERLLVYLGERQAAVYRRRLVDGATLAEVGDELGVSRERIRQIQGKMERRVERLLRSRDFQLLHWRAADLGFALGMAAPVAHDATRAALAKSLRGANESAALLLRPLLLRLAGPYREKKGWITRDQASAMDSSAIEAMADEFGLIPLTDAHELLGPQGVRSEFFDAWFDHSGKFRRDGDLAMIWSGSVVDKCVALLASRGEPADVETLVSLVGEGHNVRGVRARFFEDERLARVNRAEWALRVWGLEEYTGITDEIAQRIREAGGSIEVDVVAEEIVNQFKVQRTSVLLYTAAPMFVVEGDQIRLRGDEEPVEVETALSMCSGAFRSSPDMLSLLVPVDSEVLRGSGRSMDGPIAAALGVVPGRPRTFRHEHGELSVTWPTTAAFGPSLGSTRTLAAKAGASEGERLRLDFDVERDRVTVERVPQRLDECSDTEAIRLLTGISTDLEGARVALADATDSVPADIQRVLMGRGDTELAERLPMLEVDPELESTLSDLARLIHQR